MKETKKEYKKKKKKATRGDFDHPRLSRPPSRGLRHCLGTIDDTLLVGYAFYHSVWMAEVRRHRQE